MKVDDATRAEMLFETILELRYVGQEYSLPVPLPGTEADDEFKASFHSRYLERYGHSNPEAPIEMVAIRLTGIVEFDRGPGGSRAGGNGESVEVREEVVFDGQAVEVPVVSRNQLAGRLVGPAIVMESSTTTVVPPGWELRVGPQDHLVMERTGGSGS